MLQVPIFAYCAMDYSFCIGIKWQVVTSLVLSKGQQVTYAYKFFFLRKGTVPSRHMARKKQNVLYNPTNKVPLHAYIYTLGMHVLAPNIRSPIVFGPLSYSFLSCNNQQWKIQQSPVEHEMELYMSTYVELHVDLICYQIDPSSLPCLLACCFPQSDL